MRTSAIAVSGLRKAYGDKIVLDGIDLDVPAGTVFSLLGPNGAGKTTTVNVLTTLVKADGGTVRVRDVARIELGSQDYSVAGRFNGRPSAVIATYQLPGSNAVDAAAGVKKLMAQLKQRFPEDLDFARRVFFALTFGLGSAAAVVRTRSARNSGSSRSAIKNQLLAPGNGGASVGAPILARPGSVAFTKNWLSQIRPITLPSR